MCIRDRVYSPVVHGALYGGEARSVDDLMNIGPAHMIGHACRSHHVFFDHQGSEVVGPVKKSQLGYLWPHGHPGRLDVGHVVQHKTRNCQQAQVGRGRQGEMCIRDRYNRSWRLIARLVRSFVPDKAQQRRILQFCRYRLSQYIAQHTLIPSRLVKRMTSLVLAQGHMTDDPWEERRRESTCSQQEMLALPEIHENLEAMPGGSMPKGISIARRSMDYVEMARLLCLSAMSRDWLEKNPSGEEVRRAMEEAQTCLLYTSKASVFFSMSSRMAAK